MLEWLTALNLKNIEWRDPWVFWFFIPILLLLLWSELRRRSLAVPYSSLLALAPETKQSPIERIWIFFLTYASLICRVALLSLLLLALARPQFGSTETKRRTLGLDIMLVVDTSGSMRALDLAWEGRRMDRLSVLKQVLQRFIEKRLDDRLGMVVFGTEAFIQAPLTLDHDVLNYFIESLEIGMAGESTAIGDGLAAAVARLKDAKVAAPIVILLTDGENTAGRIKPMAAAEAAKTFGIKVYTIGLGSNAMVPVDVGNGMYQRMHVKLDEELLKSMAELTGGQYFNAKTSDDLLEVYNTIDQLEKSEIEVSTYLNREERYHGFALAAAVLSLFLVAGSLSPWRRLP